MSVVHSQPSRRLQYANAIAKSGLPSGVRATCWALATFADNDTGKAFPWTSESVDDHEGTETG